MFIQHYYPFVGGAERQLQALTGAFPRFGVEALVITRRLPGPDFPPYEVVASAPVYRIALRGGHVLRSVSYTIGALGVVWRERKRIDVLHAHELLSPTTTAVLAKLVIRRPVVAKVLGGGAMGDVPKLLSKPLGRTRMALFKRLVDRFLCVSDEIAQQLLAAGVPDDKLVRLANGVDTSVYAPAWPEQRARLRTELGLPDAPLVIYSGRLAPEKGPRLLARAWGQVHARRPDAHLVVLGEGPERDALVAPKASNIHLLGSQSNVLAYLQAADIFVLPSEREGLSNALLEAMATGLACVATRVGGTPELVTDGESGLLVAPNDADALAEALLRTIGDAPLRARLGAAARAFVTARYSLDAVIAQLRTLYITLTRDG